MENWRLPKLKARRTTEISSLVTSNMSVIPIETIGWWTYWWVPKQTTEKVNFLNQMDNSKSPMGRPRDAHSRLPLLLWLISRIEALESIIELYSIPLIILCGSLQIPLETWKNSHQARRAKIWVSCDRERTLPEWLNCCTTGGSVCSFNRIAPFDEPLTLIASVCICNQRSLSIQLLNVFQHRNKARSLILGSTLLWLERSVVGGKKASVFLKYGSNHLHLLHLLFFFFANRSRFTVNPTHSTRSNGRY